MDVSDRSVADNQIDLLREGIKARYRQYHQRDPDRFPIFPYNTSRANYEPLKTSFEEEFYSVRGVERTSATIYIPSTNTLAQLFTEEGYIPGKKILNTCRSYAEGPTVMTREADAFVSTRPSIWMEDRLKWFALGGLVSVSGVTLLLFVGKWLFSPAPGELTIIRPGHQSRVQQEVIVEGKAVNAETVWLIVHPVTRSVYYVQPPGKVGDNGSWVDVAYVGETNNQSSGFTYQIRAIVNPAEPLHSGMVLHSWPEAQRLSPIVEVVRDSIR